MKAAQKYYVGWDVGGWNCANNKNSRDAIAILDDDRNLLGRSWRGNLRHQINDAHSNSDWLASLFDLCGLSFNANTSNVILAIDTPLGFSDPLRALLAGAAELSPIENNACNPYLYRRTEQFLFEHGLSPLSPIKDMIGSQATKGMHVLARFAPHSLSCGVWTDDNMLNAIEAYPSACKHSDTMNKLLEPFLFSRYWDESKQCEVNQYVAPNCHDDQIDALICALIGWLFVHQPHKLTQPKPEVSAQEGWIFVPEDSLNISKKRTKLITDN